VIRIGITGGIGSGKSSVAGYWAAQFNLPLINLDQICRELLVRDNPGWLALKEELPENFFHGNGDLDRKRLRRALFADSQLRARVDNLLHPLARSHMHGAVTRADAGVVLLEIPLLFEAGWEDDVDRVVLVYAHESARIHRVARRDSVPHHEAKQALAVQASLAQKIYAADHVIDNCDAWPDTCLQVRHLGRLYG